MIAFIYKKGWNSELQLKKQNQDFRLYYFYS